MTSLNYYFLFKTVVFSNFFLVKNYCFNTFSSPGLDLKLKKCVFEVRWSYRLLFAILWRHIIINFDWKCCFRIFSRKNVNYKRFYRFTLSSKSEKKFLGSNSITTTSQPLDQKYDWVQAVFYSLTCREQYSAVKPFSQKNTERFEIATCL